MQNAIHTATLANLDTLLSEASFSCEHAIRTLVRGPWVPAPQRTHCDKIYAVLEGRGVARLNEADYHIVPGDVFLIPAGTIQQGDSDKAEPLLKDWVHFQASTTQTLQLMSLFPPPMCLKGKSAATITALLKELVDEWRGNAPARQLAVKSLLMRALLIAYRAPQSDWRKPDALRAAPQEAIVEEGAGQQRLPLERIRSVLALMNRSYSAQLSLSDLAKCACLHPTYFNQVFKRVVGMPPMKFLEQQRLRRAQELLAQSALTVAEIGEQVGYQDPYYFSRAFRKRTGLAPSAYRNQVHAASELQARQAKVAHPKPVRSLRKSI